MSAPRSLLPLLFLWLATASLTAAGVTYDKRGNINTLDRRGVEHHARNGTYDRENYDDLTYKYGGETTGVSEHDDNQLTSIDDASGSDLGYEASGQSYQYDDNGNTTYDPSRGITIDYNHLDLPVQIIWDDNRKLVMTYDATGTLLTRETFPTGASNPSATRHFIGGIEYSGSTTSPTLEVIHHEEGRIRFTGTSQEWQYSLTDHLGNTRLLYADLNNDGIPAVPSEIIQEEHYYPFGMKMTGPWMGATAGAKSAYQYNGIEYVDDFDLNVNMAFYRTLDPTTGRWWSVDPKAEKFMGLSPYNSMGNSPMNFADPDGAEPITVALGIAAALGAFNGYQIGRARGVEGVGLFGYALGGAAIGAASAGVGSAITTGVGGAVAGQFGGLIGSAVGGAAGGAVAGGGFAGLAGQDPMAGLWKGAVAGFAGGGLGAYIGGGAGSFVGGFTGSSINSALHGADLSSSLQSGLIGGATAFGAHHLTTYLNYQQLPQKSWMSYKQFRAMSTAAQKSFARGREFGGWLLEGGGVEMWKPGSRSGITPTAVPDNVLMSFHTHPNAGGNWNPDFSPPDIDYNIANNVSEYVISRQTVYAHSPPGRFTFNLGSNHRYSPYKFNSLWWER